jgi:hypothetical protein
VAYGLRVGIRVNNRDFLDEVIRRLPPIGRPANSAVVDRLYWIRQAGEPRGRIRPFHILYIDSIRHARSCDFDQILRIFEDDAEMWIAENARRRLFIHAGVVGWQGRAILLPGKSMSGKSTLVRKLVAAGATYYSDEFAVLDPHGRVHPWPRALSVRGDPRHRQDRIPLEEMGSPPGAEPLPVGLVAFSSYQQEGKWRPRLLSGGKAALALLANTVAARKRPRQALSVLRLVVSQARAIKSVRGDADQMVEELLGRPHWS